MLVVLVLQLGACALLQSHDPVQVTVAGIESLPGEGMEMRMLVKLRVQNPNDTPIEFDGVFVSLDVLDSTFGSGVSDEKGSIPRFGETVIGVPVTISALRVAMRAFGALMDNEKISDLPYKLHGKLNGPFFGSVKFEAAGKLTLPTQ